MNVLRCCAFGAARLSSVGLAVNEDHVLSQNLLFARKGTGFFGGDHRYFFHGRELKAIPCTAVTYKHLSCITLIVASAGATE